ncbi:hypothetical protein ACSE5K_10195 [Bacillus velezensis]|uniref:hypothetical protein n=1 Tax=Bacillus TaxID=1386 RepID=UPI00045874BD|nr:MULTISPECIES: hypothetical protein [Bacillus]AIW37815.1 hypothetical protein KS07_10090 [Bacillus subtilis]AHZ16293.1 hypothetical protein V529_22670 [Bacillus velezensis SQR9]AKF76281.1 hypothetical protein AAV30_08950 [Bacillus velezensis]AKF76321.1 hypothetical protein AAV30_09210 [Bacillus velezensis]AWD15485.1 hypothetical protein B9C53_19265 [Bacillus velezensis]
MKFDVRFNFIDGTSSEYSIKAQEEEDLLDKLKKDQLIINLEHKVVLINLKSVTSFDIFK